MTWRPSRMSPSSAAVGEALPGISTIRHERRRSSARYATAADRLQALFDAAKARQPTRILAFDQGLEGLSQQLGLFMQPGEFLGLGQQLVVDRHGCTHAQTLPN